MFPEIVPLAELSNGCPQESSYRSSRDCSSTACEYLPSFNRRKWP